MKKIILEFSVIIIVLTFFVGCKSLYADSSRNNLDSSKPSKELREKYILHHPELDFRTRGLIRNGIVDMGMTKEEVQASWGKAKTIKHRKAKDYDEIWVYVPNWKFKNRLFFYDGILVKTDPDYLVVSKMEGHGATPK